MKYLTLSFAVALAITSLQGCKKERSAEEIAAAEKAKTDSIEHAKTEERAARRQEHEKIAADKNTHRERAREHRLTKGLTYKDAKGNVIHLKAEEMPEFTGGEASLKNYLQQNIKYPEKAYNDNKTGTVFVDFVINKDGKVIDVNATDSVNTDVDHSLVEEAVRVVSNMPTWTPAKEKGKPVAVAYSIPIKFEMD